MLEIERLDAMLREAGIPFERADALSSKAFSIRRIQYPQRWKYVFSAIQGYGTYGHKENLLELCSREKSPFEDPEGYLTADEVFNRIKAHWEKIETDSKEKVRV